MKKLLKETIQDIYGINFDIVDVVEDLLESISHKERETYNKLCAELTDEQKQLLNTYLHLHAERVFNMYNKRFYCGYKVGMAIGQHTKKK